MERVLHLPLSDPLSASIHLPVWGFKICVASQVIHSFFHSFPENDHKTLLVSLVRSPEFFSVLGSSCPTFLNSDVFSATLVLL